ncbi:MAG: hypothetical protein U5R14_08590 [Gemmatimonadota bacterium]|nr:hypothetical protein [Gemmatimonadota bacterium]
MPDAVGLRGAIGLALTLTLSWVRPGGAQTTTLRGELLQRNGEAAADVRLVVVGHPPEVVIRDGGLFSHPLEGEPNEVTLRVVGDPELEVLYPPDGRTPVPRDPGTVAAVVVGRRIGEAVEDRIGRDLRALRETLELRGVSESDIQDVLRSELDGLVVRIADLTEGAVGRAVAGADRAELRERVSRYLRSYLRTSRDLVDAFGLIDVSRSMSQANFLALYNAMAAYSDGYAALDEGLGEAPGEVRRAWSGDSSVARELSEVLDRIHGDFHRTVLTLREPLLVIQAEYNGGATDDDELRRARQKVVGALDRLEPLLARLEAEVPPLLEALRKP